MDKNELKEMLALLKKKYADFKKAEYKLDISRGKPNAEQLDLSMPLLEGLKNYKSSAIDCRNYGLVDGIPELKQYLATYLNAGMDEIILGGNSSLNMMYDSVQRAMQFGVLGAKSWNSYEKIKFICPVPGYDRHFKVTEVFNVEMIAVPMDDNGPIMDIVEELVLKDETIKGMWCVPKYSNPTGIVYSDEVVDRLSSMKTAAKDFRIFWDNAYFVHSLYEGVQHPLKNILKACADNGNPDRVYVFGSTSKITFAGGGVAFMISSETNIKDIKKYISYQTIGPDKLNQLAHYEFFKKIGSLEEHMDKHARIIRPKFEMLFKLLEKEFSDSDILTWQKPKGGYFISVNVMPGTAKKVCKLCAECGLVITPAGATYPLGLDDLDSNLRFAPTFVNLNELEIAGEIFAVCVKIAAITKIMELKEYSE